MFMVKWAGRWQGLAMPATDHFRLSGRVSLIVIVCSLFLFSLHGAASAQISMQQRQMLRQGDVIIDASMRETDGHVETQVEVRVRDQVVARFRIADGSYFQGAEFVEMDSSNDYPEVVVKEYTGGAHCCTQLWLARAPAKWKGGRWQIIDLGAYDHPFAFTDADGDGVQELHAHDERFLYAYTAYAASYAPLQIIGIRNGKKVDLTREPAFRPLLRREARELRREILNQLTGEREGLNNHLAVYVALKILLGEGADGWKFMLKHHLPQTSAFCPLRPGAGDYDTSDCPVPELKLTFPLDLALFLWKLGYVREEQ